MAFPRLHLFFFVLLLSPLVFSSTVRSDDDEDKLLERLNSYRASLKAPKLNKNPNADCLADRIADKLDHDPCPPAITSTSPQVQFSTYSKQLDKCKLNMNNVKEGVILAACIPGKVSKVDAFNFTQPFYTQYFNQSKYTGAGIGSEDNWLVVVLSTDTPGGNFATSDAAAAAAKSLGARIGVAGNLVALLLGFFLGLVG